MLQLSVNFGDKCTGFCRSEYIGHIPDTRFLQRMLRRIRHSGGTEIRSEGLYYNAPLCGGQLATGCGDVGGACRGNKHLLCRYLRMMRTPDNIFTGAYYYLLVTFIGVPCTFFYNLLSSIIRALGDSKTPFWFLLFSTVLNILLDLFASLFWTGVWRERQSLLSFLKEYRQCFATSI